MPDPRVEVAVQALVHTECVFSVIGSSYLETPTLSEALLMAEAVISALDALDAEPMKAFESHMADENDRLRRERNEARAEVERLRKRLHDDEAHDDAIDAIERVRALCDDVIDGSGLVSLVRAALDGEGS